MTTSALSLQDLRKLATCQQLHYLGVMNTIRNLLDNLHNIFCSTCELLRYALTFLRSILCSRAVQAARLLAVESQFAACRQRIDSKKRRQPRFTESFRLLWVVLSKFLDEWEDLACLMQPATVKRWYSTALRYFWRWKSRRKSGRPPIPSLLCRKALANPLTSTSSINVS